MRTACLRIPWSPLGPLQPNSAVMFPGRLDEPPSHLCEVRRPAWTRATAAAIIQRKWTSSMSATTPIASTSQPQTAMFTKMALIQPYDGVGSLVTPHFRGNLLASAPISNFRHNVLFVLSSHTFHDRKPFIVTCKHHSALCCGIDLSYLVISHNFLVTQNCPNAKKSKEYYLVSFL